MYSKAKISNHPIHPMLVGFPIAFYTAALAAYAFYGFAGNNPFWFQVGYIANIAGVVTAVIAAIPGFVDWAFGVPKKTAAKSTGWIHMLLNVSALVLFGASAWISYIQLGAILPNVGWQLSFGAIGLGLTMAAGYFGWELVGTHHVGVDGKVVDTVEIPDDSVHVEGAVPGATTRTTIAETMNEPVKDYPHVKPLRSETKTTDEILKQTNRM